MIEERQQLFYLDGRGFSLAGLMALKTDAEGRIMLSVVVVEESRIDSREMKELGRNDRLRRLDKRFLRSAQMEIVDACMKELNGLSDKAASRPDLIKIGFQARIDPADYLDALRFEEKYTAIDEAEFQQLKRIAEITAGTKP